MAHGVGPFRLVEMRSSLAPATLSPARGVRRYSAAQYSGPERFAVAGAGVALASGVWPTLTRATGLGLACPLRSITGIPCPFCGSTTAWIHLVRGDLGAAARANPSAILIASFVVVMLGVLVLRHLGRLGPPIAAGHDRIRLVARGIGALVVASWIFQLHRFALI